MDFLKEIVGKAGELEKSSNEVSYLLKLKAVDSNYFLFLFHFYFLLDLFSFYSIFRTSVRVRVTRSHYHIKMTWLQ